MAAAAAGIAFSFGSGDLAPGWLSRGAESGAAFAARGLSPAPGAAAPSARTRVGCSSLHRGAFAGGGDERLARRASSGRVADRVTPRVVSCELSSSSAGLGRRCAWAWPRLDLAGGVLVALLHGYRWVISPVKTALFGPLGRCRFTPSCSAYALEAVRAHGAWRGGWLALRRLGRCHPWGGCGHDPVPGCPPFDRARVQGVVSPSGEV